MRRTQAPNATTKRYHQTQALMVATRPAALRQRLTDKRVIGAVCEPLFGVWALYFTDAGRVAPIRVQCPGTIVLYMTSNLLFNLSI